MPTRFANTFSPQTDLGRGLQSLTAALFGGRNTPIELEELDARRSLMEAQERAAIEGAGLNRASRMLKEGIWHARQDPAVRQWVIDITGGTPALVDRYDQLYRGGQAAPAPAAPPAAARPAPQPVQMPAAQPAQPAALPAAVAQALTGGTVEPEVRPFPTRPPLIGSDDMVTDHREALQLGAPPRGTTPLPAEFEFPGFGIYGQTDRPPRPAPGAPGAPYMEPAYPARPGVTTQKVDVEAETLEDEIMRRIGAAYAVANAVRMGDENVNLKTLADMYVELLRNPVREDALYGRMDPAEAGARIAATDPGKEFFGSSPQGLYNKYTGQYSDATSPALTASTAYDEARARAEDAQTRLRDAQVPREGAHADLYRAQAGWYNERDRSSSRARGGDDEIKPAERTMILKAINAALSGYEDNDLMLGQDVKNELASRAMQIATDPDGPYFKDPAGALDQAVDELAPEGFEEAGTGLTDFWQDNRIEPKGGLRRPQEVRAGGVQTGGQQAAAARTATPPSRPAGKADAQLIQEARDAIAAGADANQVNARLRAWGVKAQ